MVKGQFPVNSSYMGRVLISLHLQYNSNPKFGVRPVIQQTGDPEEYDYALQYDLFEFVPNERQRKKNLDV